MYCNNLTNYSRRATRTVDVGGIPLGGNNPIRVQSMTTVDTMDTLAIVEESIRMIEAGCEYVRVTAPSIKEAENLQNIKDELWKRGYKTPLIADIHFTPNAAEMAARIVEKVRVNPGNYADKKKFEFIEYDDSTYQEELERIRERFIPLIKICKEYGTAMRIGTNHGSLSDRIMSRYGDTAIGMVESALEFLRICEDLNYHDVVLSMKSSNTQVMVQAYRLLVKKLLEEKLQPYPLHLGVTEAGEGEDGRIKSAVGIGTLLEDGLGDTIRVSLTEAPEEEIPVAKTLVNRYDKRHEHDEIKLIGEQYHVNPYEYNKRESSEVGNIGGSNVPRVIADFSNITNIDYHTLKSIGHFYLPEPDKFTMNDVGSDYIYSGSNPISFMLPNGLREIMDYKSWVKPNNVNHAYPIYHFKEYIKEDIEKHRELNFVEVDAHQFQDFDKLKAICDIGNVVLVVSSSNSHAMASVRAFFNALIDIQINMPVIVSGSYDKLSKDEFRLHASTDVGGLLIDGLGDGTMLNAKTLPMKVINDTAFGILQAARVRITKAEYISCPSCGRTLFDLQETTAMIRKRTDHLKGVKIGIMGCIVNGPGEMADADYGYVGSGKGKITLYKGKEVIQRSVPSKEAVDKLIDIIKEDGNWTEPVSVIEY